MRILYIEDNTQDADLTRRELARSAPNHRMEIATTLAEAWALLKGPDFFDLALVDLDLPDGSGIEFVIGVRERDLPLAVVVLTGSGDERSAVAALKAGADDYLVKGGDHLRLLPQVMESARAAFGAGRARRTRPLRVLYAEHNPADLDLVRRHLARHSPHIHLEGVGSGEEVLARLAGAEAPPDVLLLDYRLRGLDALELIVLLQTRDLLRMPVVLVTGQGDEGVAVRALRAGAADYLVKRTAYLHELAATLENTHHRALLWREQAALRASEERFRQLAENIDEIFWIVRPGYVEVLYVSPAYAKVWGRPCTDLLAAPRSWLDAVVPEDRDGVLAWRDAVPQGGARVVEYRIQRPDGVVRWIRDRASPVRDTEGLVYRVVGVAEDITERRHLEEQLRQSQKMEAIGQLSGGVAHDFNNLLTIIQGHLGLIEAGGRLPPCLEASIGQISQAATRASNLTRQLLTFSRKQVMQSRDLDLRTVVADVAKMLQRILGEDVELRVEAGDQPLWIHADPGMIEQVLMNFTVNARDAMPRGGRLSLGLATVPFSVVRAAGVELEESDAPHGYVCMTVEDTGTGIAPAVIGRIFEPFFTTKPVGKGTGLGLATVYGIVRQHRGAVKARSEPGQGACFEVYLPRVAAPGLFLPSPETRPAVLPAKAGGETVLVVEDDPAVSEMVNLALGWYGHRVLLAGNGHEALRLWAAHRDSVRLLLTDFVMPDGMSGRELADRVLSERPGLPVIYMSGYSAEIAGRELGDLSTINFLPKPFGVEALHQAVLAALARGKAVKQSNGSI
jgi:PAS domain S-box-containing protein